MLIEHARYNEEFIRDHFVSDIQLVTSVRDAVSWFQSAVHFWHRQADEKVRGHSYEILAFLLGANHYATLSLV